MHGDFKMFESSFDDFGGRLVNFITKNFKKFPGGPLELPLSKVMLHWQSHD